jgi:hypothetical protein
MYKRYSAGLGKTITPGYYKCKLVDCSEGVNMYWKPAPEWHVRWDYSETMSVIMKDKRGLDIEDYCVE